MWGCLWGLGVDGVSLVWALLMEVFILGQVVILLARLAFVCNGEMVPLCFCRLLYTVSSIGLKKGM